MYGGGRKNPGYHKFCYVGRNLEVEVEREGTEKKRKKNPQKSPQAGEKDGR